jgi:hypothetical protein
MPRRVQLLRVRLCAGVCACGGTNGRGRYVFVVDKAKRGNVFVGEFGAHPHAGTSDFVYENS